MKKVIVIGCPGSGKSTFARRLRDKTGLPLYYLDRIWHKEDKSNITREEFDDILANVLKGDRWIIDGNYSRTLEMRLRECDTVFLLDFPTEICLAGAEGRVGQVREEMPWVEEEFDPEFRQFIIDFSRVTLPKIYELLEKYSHKSIIIFKTREEMNQYI